MTTVSLQIVGIIEPIIQHADWFFPGGEVLCQLYLEVARLQKINKMRYWIVSLSRLSQKSSLTSQGIMEALSTPTTTPTTARCRLRTWIRSIVNRMTRVDGRSVSPQTTWCWSSIRKTGTTLMSLTLHFKHCLATIWRSGPNWEDV